MTLLRFLLTGHRRPVIFHAMFDGKSADQRERDQSRDERAAAAKAAQAATAKAAPQTSVAKVSTPVAAAQQTTKTSGSKAIGVVTVGQARGLGTNRAQLNADRVNVVGGANAPTSGGPTRALQVYNLNQNRRG